MDDSSNAKSPDTETPPQTEPTIPNSITFKRHRHLQPPAVVFYKECLKNHAAGIGGLALDGCGEFMPSHSDPSSLKCAACACHRNFHRRELEDPSAAHFISFRHPQSLPPPLNRSLTPSPITSRSQFPPSPVLSAPNMLLALSTGHSDDYNLKALNRGKRENPNGGKRFRTKFSQTQKEKMQAFAEKLGWKMHKSDVRAVEEFCNEVGVSRGVLKVWIHNNKQTSRKRDHHQISNINNGNADNHGEEHGHGNGSRVSFDTDAYNNNNNTDNEHHHQNECNSIVHLHVSTNGSSSSS